MLKNSCDMSYARNIPCYHLFFFNDPATTEIYTLSLHDALPILAWNASTAARSSASCASCRRTNSVRRRIVKPTPRDRKSTRLNSSHLGISYAVFCLKKKKIQYMCSIYGVVRSNQQVPGAQTDAT